MAEEMKYVEIRGRKFPLTTEHPSRLKTYPGLELHAPGILPPRVDLTNHQVRVMNQGESNACTAFATCAALESLAKRHHQQDDFSEFFLYHQTEIRSGRNPADNQGMFTSEAIGTLEADGVCLYATWSQAGKSLRQMESETPSAQALAEAKRYLVTNAAHIRGGLQGGAPAIKNALALESEVIVSFDIYENFDNYYWEMERTGKVHMGVGRVKGAHTILLVGYDDTTRLWKFKNSWGADWGDHGYGYLPYDYPLSDDMWVIMTQSYKNSAPPATPLSVSNVFKHVHGVSPSVKYSPWTLRQAIAEIEKHEMGFSSPAPHGEDVHISYSPYATHGLPPAATLAGPELQPLSPTPPHAVNDALSKTPTVVIGSIWPPEHRSEAAELKKLLNHGYAWLAGLCSQQVQAEIDKKLLDDNNSMSVSAYYAKCKDYYIRNSASTWLTIIQQKTLQKHYSMERSSFHATLLTDVLKGLPVTSTVFNAIDGILQTIANSISTATSQNANFHITIQKFNWQEAFGTMDVTMRTFYFSTDASTKEFADLYSRIQDRMDGKLAETGKTQVENAEKLPGPSLAPP